MGEVVPVVGMVGAGQLARMSLAPAAALGVRLRLLAASAGDAAAQVAAEVDVGDPGDRAALAAFAAGVDVLTFDHELVDLGLLAELEAAGHAVRPAPAALALAVDKRHQRAVLGGRGLPVPANAAVASAADVAAFAAANGWPVVLKAATGGYDGRGVWVLDGPGSFPGSFPGPLPEGSDGQPLLAEAHVDIERELAVLVARRPGGQAVTWPLVETVQRDGICVELVAPARVEPAVAAEATALGLAVAEAAGVSGVLAVELFLTTAGRLVINELATRPHNSGHWTIEGARTSQFANHLRAVLDLPLGDTGLAAPAVATVNLLGGPDGADPRGLERLAGALAVPGAAVHLYGKAARPGRKLGHVTALGADQGAALAAAHLAAGALT